jgi:predicted acyltransferase
VAAVISLAVPVVPAIVALVLAAAAARSRRNRPAGALSDRRLVSAACVLSVVGLVVWAGLAASIMAVPTQPDEPMTLQARPPARPRRRRS